MITNDGASHPQERTKRLRFDRYVLDLDRGCLFLNAKEIAIRPKTFAVLQFLIENRGRLVSKNELIIAVWPNVAITDDALVQSIGELRRALGDDGSRLIRTIPRRGYRFETTVSDIPAIDPPVPDDKPDSPVVVEASERAIRTYLSALLTAPVTSQPRKLFAAMALVIVLAIGALWTGSGLPLPGRQFSTTPEITSKPAIAVLPFLNLDGDPAREYFVDGLTQDIINALGHFSELTVMSWNAVLPSKGKQASPVETARNLAVRYQVEGSVRQNGERVRVIAQLVDADGRVLWSSRFDEALAHVFALQDKITTQITRALAIRVTQIEKLSAFSKPTESLRAYDYVLRARPAMQRPARANVVEARALLRRAIELDPNYAAAYAALAESYYVAVSMGWAESPTTFLSRAEELANKALSLNDSEVRARIILGRIHIFYQRYEQAKAEMDRAIAINPNDAQGLAGRGNILMWLGQIDPAITALELAQHIDPELNAMDRFALSLAYYLKQRYDAAIAQAELSLRETAGANFSHIVLAAAYAQQNRSENAAQVAALIVRMDPTFDPRQFGTKFLNSRDLENLRDGLRKANLYPAKAGDSNPDR
jgi:TolB-like protein/DNA-binding winged helix-turn-helix (wHTH) protein/cytochrome c-type biogenesis protein CcmH/NrfG